VGIVRVGAAILGRVRGRDTGYPMPPPSTDPYVQHYRIRLLPQVMTPKRATEKGCFGTCLR